MRHIRLDLCREAEHFAELGLEAVRLEDDLFLF
jgi:hypothetical protein